jgi:UrcA family protein
MAMAHFWKNMSLGAGALAVAALVSHAPVAGASDLSVNADGISVKYSQEELATDADAQRVYRKLRQASRKACGLDGGFLNLPERTRAKKCYDETLAQVVQKINRPMLTALHVSYTSKEG